MNYARFLEIVTGYRGLGFDVIVKTCPDCKGNGQYIAANQRKHRIVDVDCPHCHATGRVVYPVAK